MCVTGEPCETESLMHGSAGGRRKSAPHGVTRRRPTLHDDDEADEPQRSLFSWAEFIAEEPVKSKGRKSKPQPATLSMFEWALTLEQAREEEPVGAGR